MPRAELRTCRAINAEINKEISNFKYLPNRQGRPAKGKQAKGSGANVFEDLYNLNDDLPKILEQVKQEQAQKGSGGKHI
ncbi:hypothetical protein NHP190012_16310 (plasmid) [Helicobacter sp. NHP19-012]|uniref:Uncharacterized protein n=1 Tax=Helicobacter gastrofelis TaxID=2849642 RepID=A0ABM7SQQ0_9HELI|nr:hypothetical protein NHP190012_16310 [Helicobacter sp. NHP19-012]GMB96773.1 hypothetical protein NHP22001_13620 [Helicobacter sp. NHP22-001]